MHNPSKIKKKRFLGITHALRGAFLLLKTERNFQLQCVAALLVTVLGLYCNISVSEWIFQTLVIALVLGLEAVNTAIEKLSDFIHPEIDSAIKDIKDIAAAAVLIAAIASLIIALIIYGPKLL